ncbi:MAG TPA: glutathione peroxidase [Verrucomicrobiae bacterium]|nr:glutathione peroxidase [Verrucomicrobiae bacterium]
MKILTTFAALLAATTLMADSNLLDIPLKDIDGKATSLKAYQGKVMLVVNVASRCGFTPQYKGLEALHRKFKEQGFTVLGFPSNDFGGQEPGTTAEIKEFCSTNYDVTFPMFDKVKVKGDGKHPLYAALTGQSSPFPGDVGWNFGKFLIGADGKILARFDSRVSPESADLISAVEKALAAK